VEVVMTTATVTAIEMVVVEVVMTTATVTAIEMVVVEVVMTTATVIAIEIMEVEVEVEVEAIGAATKTGVAASGTKATIGTMIGAVKIGIVAKIGVVADAMLGVALVAVGAGRAPGNVPDHSQEDGVDLGRGRKAGADRESETRTGKEIATVTVTATATVAVRRSIATAAARKSIVTMAAKRKPIVTAIATETVGKRRRRRKRSNAATLQDGPRLRRKKSAALHQKESAVLHQKESAAAVFPGRTDRSGVVAGTIRLLRLNGRSQRPQSGSSTRTTKSTTALYATSAEWTQSAAIASSAPCAKVMTFVRIATSLNGRCTQIIGSSCKRLLLLNLLLRSLSPRLRRSRPHLRQRLSHYFRRNLEWRAACLISGCRCSS